MGILSADVKAEISKRFSDNLARVQSLIGLYPAGGAGRRDVATTDLLRAAVVFLHATLEDLLRSMLEWKLPTAAASALEEVVLPGHKPRSRFAVSDLAVHRGKTVDDVLRESVAQHLADSNFNHPGELVGALEKVGLAWSLVQPYRDLLGPMMSRRHWIVHRADRNQDIGSGQHSARALDLATVEAWRDAVRSFGEDVLNAV